MSDEPKQSDRPVAARPTDKALRTIFSRDLLGVTGINANGSVKRIEIMDYKESYGYEVRDAAWRAQIVGKSASSPLRLNADITNISDATLSSKHITDGVKRILQKYESSLKGQR